MNNYGTTHDDWPGDSWGWTDACNTDKPLARFFTAGEPQYVRQTASFVVNVSNSEGVVSKYVFALDGHSLSAKTQALIELMRSIHAKYASQ